MHQKVFITLTNKCANWLYHENEAILLYMQLNYKIILWFIIKKYCNNKKWNSPLFVAPEPL